ncbi:flavodoxin [Clostridia bacterium]|nr:flavodoxin [Clostridia bacterium]
MGKNIAVIYGTKHGTTKRYAEWIAEELGAALFARNEIRSDELQNYDCVVFGGGLYASAIIGADLVAKNPCKNLVLFTVGLGDPQTSDYSEHMSKNFPPSATQPLKVFHLRGGIDYSQLNLVHRGMMAMMKKMTVDKKKPEERTTDDQLLARTYGGKIDFTDRETIMPIVEYVRGLPDVEGKP